MVLIIILFAAQASADPAALWQEAKAFLEQQQYAEARRVLTLAVKASPKDPAFWYHLGVSCAELKDADAAIRAFETARKLAPQRAEVYFSLGLEYWHRGDVGKAKESYQAGLALEPKEPRALQNYALLLMKTGEYQKAIAPLVSLKDVPQLALPSRVSLIECYLKMRDRTQAERETDELLRSGIAGPPDETKLGAILIEEGDADAAERVLRTSLSQQPDQAKACAALGIIVLNKKSYQEAAELLGRAVNLDPDSSEYAMAFAETLLLWKRDNQLLGFLKSVEPKFGQLPEFQYKMALAYYGAAKISESVVTLEKLLRMNPRRKDQIYYILGNSYLTMGKLVEAEKAYRNAMEMNPKDPAYSEQFAAVLRSEGPERLEEAIAQLKRARQLDASNAGLALQLALSYESKGDLKSAVGPAEEAVRLRPDVLPAHVALARIYFRLGRRTDGQKEKSIIAKLEEAQQLRDAKRGTGESVDAEVR